jgi:SAM-dependent methyltransferase
MLSEILEKIAKDKLGVEIGGKSDSGEVIYKNVDSMDNVVFSNETIWGNHSDEFNFFGNKKGKIIINDATNISDIGNEKYDFCFASHCLEHIANPLKAVKEWLRIIKNDGYIVLILPEKTVCFDHNRKISKFSTLLSQFEKGVNEDDLSTLVEILQNHDLSMDRPAGDLGQFTKRSLDNMNNRCLHHYVYDPQLLQDICNFFGCEFIYTVTENINIWFIMKKKTT